MAALSAWIGNAVVIGYTVGFDLAMLRAERERHGLAWSPPRSLCLRHLVQLVAPELPDPSLEMVASWLGVEPGERHRALRSEEQTSELQSLMRSPYAVFC